LCDAQGAFLFQVRPDLFPEGYMGAVELELWGLHWEKKNRDLQAAQRKP